MKNKYLYKNSNNSRGYNQSANNTSIGFAPFLNTVIFFRDTSCRGVCQSSDSSVVGVSLHSQGWWRCAAQIVMEPHLHCVVQTHAKNVNPTRRWQRRQQLLIDLGAFFLFLIGCFLALKLGRLKKKKKNPNFGIALFGYATSEIFWIWLRGIMGWCTTSQTCNDGLTTWNFPKNFKLKRSAVKSNSVLFWHCALKLP